MNVPISYSIRLRNDRAELQRVGIWINKTGEQLGLPVNLIYKLDVCADEALMNVIDYAYDDDESHEIDVRLSRLGQLINLEVEDDGKEFIATCEPSPLDGVALEDAPIGGLGLHLIHSLMDECRQVRRDGKNLLILSATIDGSTR